LCNPLAPFSTVAFPTIIDRRLNRRYRQKFKIVNAILIFLPRQPPIDRAKGGYKAVLHPSKGLNDLTFSIWAILPLAKVRPLI
jgi:hypothetical protein